MMEIRLAICKEGGVVRSIKIPCNPCRIGRSDDCDLQLNSRSVSRNHCELKLKQAGLTIKDLGSRNGTIVNGVPAPAGVRLLLRKNDRIKIGKYEMKVTDEVPIVSESSEESPISEDTSSESSTQVGSELLDMLEQFIAENRSSMPVASGEARSGRKPDSEKAAEVAKKSDPWTVLKEPAIRSHEVEGPSKEIEGSGDRALVDSTATIETKAALPSEETQVEAAEARRLDLRDRLESLKAKDSREAADRALKNLFRR